VTRDIATRNWLWEKIEDGKYYPTCFRDWLWLLFIVIVKETNQGNCFRWNLKGILVSNSVDLGIKTL